METYVTTVYVIADEIIRILKFKMTLNQACLILKSSLSLSLQQNFLLVTILNYLAIAD